MNLFFSGVGKGVIETDARLGSPRYRLFSCHGQYFKYAQQTGPLVSQIDDQFEIMLDSGAFTAWTKGEEVTLDHLIRDYGTLIEDFGYDISKIWLINLDKIPAEPGRDPTPQELDEAIKISDENFHTLRETFGDRIIPVFHQGEGEGRLAEICSMARYVCISPRNDLGETYRRTWAKETHQKIPAGVRTHGLATTGHPMMTTIPWHSVDSATWIMIAAYGHIYFNEKLQSVSISDDQPNRHEIDQHYINIPEQQKEMLHSMMDEWGFTYDGLRSDFVERAIWNRLMMTRLYRSIGEIHHPVQAGLFDL
jgi:hypothetical protein